MNYRKIILSVLLTIVFIIVSTSAGFAETKTLGHGLGLKVLHEKVPMYSKQLKVTGLPASIDLSPGLPPVGDQGMQNSCTAWATGYYLKSYEEAKDHHWTPNRIATTYSPSFIYNQINFGYDSGSYIEYAFDLLQTQGCATLESMPYSNDNLIDDGSHYDWDNDVRLQPTDAQRQNAAKYKAAAVYGLQQGNVEQIKAWLSTKSLVVLGIPVTDDFVNLNSTNKIFDNLTGTLYGYHAITLTGYSDSLQAFKFVNSWGKNYGIDGGFGYISYDLVRQQSFSPYVSIDDQSPTVVSLKVTKPTTTKVGKNWSYKVTVGGKTLTTTKPLTTELSNFIIKVTEKDTHPDVKIVKGNLKYGMNKVKVTVRENGGRYKGKTATWYFYISRN